MSRVLPERDLDEADILNRSLDFFDMLDDFPMSRDDMIENELEVYDHPVATPDSED